MTEKTSMRRFSAFAIVVVLATLAVGCAPNPKPPKDPKDPKDPCAKVVESGGFIANLGDGCETTTTTTTSTTTTSTTTTSSIPVQECDASTQSGGAGVTTTFHDLGTAGPTSFLFEFNAYSQPDRFQVLYEGTEIFDTGWRGSGSGWTGPDGNPITIVGPGAGSATVDVPAGSATGVVLVVTGQGPGTIWDYVVNCPQD